MESKPQTCLTSATPSAMHIPQTVAPDTVNDPLPPAEADLEGAVDAGFDSGIGPKAELTDAALHLPPLPPHVEHPPAEEHAAVATICSAQYAEAAAAAAAAAAAEATEAAQDDHHHVVSDAATAMIGGAPDVAPMVLPASPEVGGVADDVDVDADVNVEEPCQCLDQPQYDELGNIVPTDHDVLSGRGASINVHRGNQHFRALCFQRKPEFDAGNHAVKRRIATEIVDLIKSGLVPPGRFLKRQWEGAAPRKGAAAANGQPAKGPWREVTYEKAILKACQVMRDFQRPDRLALKEMYAAEKASGDPSRMAMRKRRKLNEAGGQPGATEGATLTETTIPLVNNSGAENTVVVVKDEDEDGVGVDVDVDVVQAGLNDVLAGRGAFVNSHPGNQRLRDLALERKDAFDRGNYADKRALAAEIVRIIRAQNPPGRFLRRLPGAVIKSPGGLELKPRGLEGFWEELNDEKAVHKACQVMRDLKRPDRMGDRSGFVMVSEKLQDGDSSSAVETDSATYPPLTAAALAEHNAAAEAAAAVAANAHVIHSAIARQSPLGTAPDDNTDLVAAAAAETVEALNSALRVAAHPADDGRKVIQPRE